MQWLQRWARKPGVVGEPAGLHEPGQAVYRLTAKGRGRLDNTRVDEMDSRVRELLELCARSAPMQRLRQSMPPRSLEATLRELLACGWIERDEPRPPSASHARPDSGNEDAQPGPGLSALQMQASANSHTQQG